jgi:hypothetical protein
MLASVTLLAWFPLVQPIVPVAEDRLILDFYADGYLNGLLRSLEWQGVWRILGFSLVGFAANLHPLALPFLAAVTHFANVWCFAVTCFRLIGDVGVVMSLAAILAVLPIGYQALAWGVCYPFVLASLIFWIQLYVTIRYGDRLELRKPLFLFSAGLTLVGALSNECMLAASLTTSSWLWLREKPYSFRSIISNMRTYYVGWAPYVGGGLYVLGYYAFLPGYVMKSPGVFNPRSLLSAYYHAVSATGVFGAWASPLLRDLGFESWNPGTSSTMAVLLLVLLLLSVYGAKYVRISDSEPRQSLRVVFTTGVLLFGASFIYAVGGGFSPESRKLYPICYLIALAIGLVLVFVRRRRLWLVISIIVLVCCVPTCWLLTGVWQFEAARSSALARTLVKHRLYDSIQIRSDTDPYKAWPYLVKSYGFRMDEGWVLDHPLNGSNPAHRGGLKILPEARAVLSYRRGKGWSYEERKDRQE